LNAIVYIAISTPEIKHWLPTRESAIVNAYLKSVCEFPANLTVRLSATKIDAAPPKSAANTSTVHALTQGHGHVCPAPQQGNACGDCRACWRRDIANVSYHKH